MSPGIPISMIPEPQRADLLKRELYKPRAFGLEGGEETGLLMRVRDLSPFHNPALPVALKLVAYQGDQDTWVIGVALRVMELPQGTLVAAAYLNPRQARDYELLSRLSSQQTFHIIFLSEDVRDGVDVALSWSAVQREEVFRIIENINKNLTSHRLGGGFDPDFEAALSEFQRDYAVKDLLAE